MKILALFLSCLLVLPAFAKDAEPATHEWPLKIEGARVPIVLYQPQPDSLTGDKLTGRAAVSVQPAGKDAVFGAVWMEARVATDRNARTVTLEDVKITRARFAGSTPEQEEMLSRILSDELTRKHFVISLDRLLVSLENAKKELTTATDLKMDPPKIYVEKSDTVLLLLDGEPQLRPMTDSPDQRVVNTPFSLILTKSNQWRLQVGDRWLTASDLKGPWKDEASASAAVPKIIVSKVPAELIVSKGEPAYAPLPGNTLLYMSNTENDVFVETATSNVFILLSGRWYSAPNLNGPWTFVRPDQLPKDFAKISPASAKGSVLASVAGTEEAKEALLDAQIPQTAAVSRKEKDNRLQVTWDGEPKFQELEGLPVAYSLNASVPVFRVGKEGYWSCTEGIWYVSKNPTGPWVVASSVPKEIYQIPPSCPYYNCRYVHIYEAQPDVVYIGYYPGYVGCYPYYGTVVYGTGYYYSGWYGPSYYYPPPMMTWGYAFRYNPYSGWGVGVIWGPGGGGGWVVAGGGGAVGGWWGPGGYPGNRPGVPHATPYGGDRAQAKQNIYNRSQEAGGRDNNRQNAQDRSARADSKDRAPNTRNSKDNNVYADRDGNVSRRTEDGKWQDRTDSGWKDNATPKQDVQRDSQERDRGAQRSAQYQSTNRPSSGGARGGGGGMRGGGGGRRR